MTGQHTTKSSKTTFDAIIIGAGVIGCSIAHSLTKSGYKTLNLDSLPAAGYGSTSSSAAIIRTYYSTLDGTAMAYEGYHDWAHWEDYLDLKEDQDFARFVKTGTLVMKTEGNGYLAKVRRNADRLGIPYEDWTPERICRAMPGYDLSCYAPAKKMEDDAFGEPNGATIPGAVFFPRSGYVDDPQLAARNLKTAAEHHGGVFAFNAKVRKIRTDAGRISGVETEDGQIVSAPVVVNAAGPHSNKVNAMLGTDTGMTIRTRPLRQEIVQVPPPIDLGYSRDGLIVSDNDVAVYLKPGGGGQMMLGSENPACDAPIEEDPDDFSRDLTDRALTYAYRYSQRLPDLGVSPHPVGIADLYDATDDWLPIYDCSDVPGYYLAIGTSGNQFKNAPVAGRLMAALIGYCENGGSQDHEPLHFPLQHVDHTIDTATFSRKRAANQESSFSVLG